MFPFLYLGLFLITSILITVFLGRHMVSVFDGRKTWFSTLLQPIESMLSKLGGQSLYLNQSWKQYCFDLLLFNLCSGILVFFVLVFQNMLPFNSLHLAGMEPWQAF